MQQSPNRLQAGVIQALGIAMLIGVAVLIYLLIALWPIATAAPTGATPTWDPSVTIVGRSFTLDADRRILLIVAVAGALGSFVQIATSFSTYVGNRSFVASWAWWYVLRLPIGIVLALLLYIVARGGFLSTVNGTEINLFGFAALGGLAGMFSKQASDKLEAIFEEVFKNTADASRMDKLGNPTPTLVEIDPPKLNATLAQVTLVGSNFVNGTSVTINGTARKTAFVDTEHLRVVLEPTDTATAGTQLKIVATNPEPGGGASQPLTLTV